MRKETNIIDVDFKLDHIQKVLKTVSHIIVDTLEATPVIKATYHYEIDRMFLIPNEKNNKEFAKTLLRLQESYTSEYEKELIEYDEMFIDEYLSGFSLIQREYVLSFMQRNLVTTTWTGKILSTYIWLETNNRDSGHELYKREIFTKALELSLNELLEIEDMEHKNKLLDELNTSLKVVKDTLGKSFEMQFAPLIFDIETMKEIQNGK